MDQIKLQVQRARRRLVLQQFLRVVGWSLFAFLLVAAIGLGVPKIWVLPIEADAWMWSWTGGAVGLGLLVACGTTWLWRRGALEAAIEIDRRFGLKERVSSSLSLAPQDVDTEVGRALVADAIKRVSEIDVRDQFRVRAPWTVVLPLVPAIAVFVLAVVVPDAVKDKSSQASAAATKPNVIKKEVDKLKQQLQRKREEMKEKGLTEAEQLLKELEKGLDDLNKKDNVEKKKAMIKINDLAKMIEERRKDLAGSQEIRKQMDRLKDIQKGPADEVTEALKDGDFKKAVEELEKLREKLNKGDLTAEQQKELAEQLSQMQKKMEEVKQAYDETKKQLENQIKEKMENGDLAGANELQKQLDKLNSMAPQMNALQKMAQKLGEASEAAQNGQSAQAAQKLSELAESLDQMQSELEQLESLEETLDQLAEAKEGMGESDSMSAQSMLSQLGGDGQQMGDMPGYGMDEGRGRGERPEEATDTQNYESPVDGKLQKGKAVITGTAEGPNVQGESREDAKDAVRSSMAEPADPLSDAQLPRDQRDHTREYFQKYQPE